LLPLCEKHNRVDPDGIEFQYFMSRAEELVSALKAELRRRGLSYAMLAEHLEVSESTVKRLCSSGSFSLRRLLEVCDVLGIGIGELAALADERQRNVEQLEADQEQALVENSKLLLVAFLLLNDWRVPEILDAYELDELEIVRLLAQLDRLKLIDLLPGNRVRMRLSRRFAWRSNGPIQRFFERHVQSEFFQSRFDQPGELRLVLHGMLSEGSMAVLHQRLARLADEFEARVREDRNLAVQQRQGTSAVLAFRPWSLSIFENLRRTK
jgi:transcriptional regulator with XRE-family HTH domain